MKWIAAIVFAALALPVAAADPSPKGAGASAGTTELTPAQKKQVQENTATEKRPTAMTKEEAKASKAKKGAAPMTAEQAQRVERTASESRPTAMTKEEVKASKEKGRTKVTPADREEIAKKNPGS